MSPIDLPGSLLTARTALLAALLFLPPSASEGGCPDPPTIEARIGEAGVERATRTAHYSVPAPTDLYARAARHVGEVFTSRDGDKGFGVTVAEVPVEALWKAVSDDDAHDEGDYLPLDRSEVIGGAPRSVRRRVFQSGSKLGLGRWWIVWTNVSVELFEDSGGRLWEATWADDMESVSSKQPPVEDPPDLSPIEWSRGAWLLVPLGEECTLVEHFSWSEAGGFVGFVQGLALGKALTQTVEGMVRLADERYRGPVEGPPFVRPDGTPLEAPPPVPPRDTTDARAE